jgi:hypothetical protein
MGSRRTSRTVRLGRALAVAAAAIGLTLLLPAAASAASAASAAPATTGGDVTVQYENIEIVSGWWNCEVTRSNFSTWAWVDPYCQGYGLNTNLYYFTWTCRIC